MKKRIYIYIHIGPQFPHSLLTNSKVVSVGEGPGFWGIEGAKWCCQLLLVLCPAVSLGQESTPSMPLSLSVEVRSGEELVKFRGLALGLESNAKRKA